MGNSNSRIDSSQEPTKEQLKHLRDLPLGHRTKIMDAFDDPTKKAKAAVLIQGGTMPLPEATKKQITLVYQDCYNDIAQGEVDEVFRHAIVHYAFNSDYEDRKEVQQAVERLVLGCKDGERGEVLGVWYQFHLSDSWIE